jgi:UDP-N-acetyl-D-mannosaminuronate dehydrogenase
VSYVDPWIPSFDHGGHAMTAVEAKAALASKPDCVVICADHKAFDYDALIKSGTLVVDTRNALKGRTAPNIFRL